MIKSLGFLVLWLAGSTAAVAVAWAGVSVVDDELVDPAPAAFSVSAGAALDRAEPVVDPAVTAGPSSTITTTTSTIPSAPTTTVVGGSTAGPAPTTPTLAPAGPPPTTTPPAQPTPPTTTVPAPTTTTAPPPPTASPTTTTFTLVGGSTAISFSASGVEVLWATPNPGFDVSIEPESPGLKVEFRADHHRSRVDAWWANGPRHEIREEPKN